MEKQAELISVIVPVYMVEKYLDRCIQSIVRQSYQNLEIILVDDGSKDASGMICDRWAEKDTRIRVIHQENFGLSVARNIGLKAASGQYIGFVDSDDFICSEMYEEMHRQISSFHADMVFCEFQNFVWEGDVHTQQFTPDRARIYSVEEAFYRLYASDCDRMNLAWNKLYRRELFDGIQYPVGRIYEDSSVIHYILEKCNVIVQDKAVLYYRQLQDESIMGQQKKDGFHEKQLDCLIYKKDRVERYREIEDRQLYACMCADYCQNLIVLYMKARKYAKNTKIHRRLYEEFRSAYAKMRKEVSFDIVKKIKYTLFYQCTDVCYLLMCLLEK